MGEKAGYPLAWPPGWPRTPHRMRGPYRTSLHNALGNLKTQLRLFGGDKCAGTLTLSSNVTLGVNNPTDPGVVAYASWDGMEMAIPCDRWSDVAHNVQAIALTIEAMRAIERHGAKHMIRAMFQGFVALPGPEPDPTRWSRVLARGTTVEQVKRLYHELAKEAHPDQGGSAEAMAALTEAYRARIAAVG